jgi:predicted phage replisome organizer
MTKKNASELTESNIKSGEISWIKMNLDIFENKKIKTLEQLPQGDTYIVIWFKLLCLAGITNDHGMIYLIEGKPYTLDNLAHRMNRPVKIVKKALESFEDLKMIEIVQGIIVPTNWGKYQSIDRLNELSLYNRVKKQESRKRLSENVKQMSNSCQAKINDPLL